MSLLIEQQVSLTSFNSLGLKSYAEQFTCLETREQLPDLLSLLKKDSGPVLWLGGGSNLVLAEQVPGLVVQMGLAGLEIIEDRGELVRLRVGAGEEWHSFVLRCLKLGLHGIENLALIPGTVGAAPVQNIGAYGVEVGQFITSVEVIDTHDNYELKQLSAAQCLFSYRDSIFKQNFGRYLILSVEFCLSSIYVPLLKYDALVNELKSRQIDTPSAAQLIDAVCAVRSSKLPDPKRLGNVGSFFKNPVVSGIQYESLLVVYPDMPSYPDQLGRKLAAGWLIDRCGWKGKRLGTAGVHKDQALVLVNFGGATRSDIEALADQVKTSVFERFGVNLEQEPQSYP